MAEKMSGTCLCGNVAISVNASALDVGACHCAMCRRWTGGPFMVIHTDNRLDMSGEDFIKSCRSSEWAERAFCSTCGTSLFYRLLSTGEHFVSAALFGDELAFELKSEIYVEHKPGYYGFLSPDSQKKTEAQVNGQE